MEPVVPFFSDFYLQIIYNLICIFTPIKKMVYLLFLITVEIRLNSISYFSFRFLLSSPVQSLLLWPHLHHHPGPSSLLSPGGPGGCGRQAGVSGGSDPGRPQFSWRWEQQLYMTRKWLVVHYEIYYSVQFFGIHQENSLHNFSKFISVFSCIF